MQVSLGTITIISLLASATKLLSASPDVPTPPWTGNQVYPGMLAIRIKIAYQHLIRLHSPKRSRHCHLLYIFQLLILNAADCQLNPGPKYPCGICGKAVRWSATIRSLACDDCDTWYHIKCMGMCTAVYDPLTQSQNSWHCCNCGIPKFNTSLFQDTHVLDQSSNPSLDDTQEHLNSDIDGPFNPTLTSGLSSPMPVGPFHTSPGDSHFAT